MGPWCMAAQNLNISHFWGKSPRDEFSQDDFTRAWRSFFLRVNEKTVLLRNYFMHISLCFHSTSKANEIQAKQRRGGTPAKYPHLKRNQAIKSARVRQHKYKYKCKIGWKDGKGCSRVTSLARVVTWAGKRVLSNSKTKFKIESFNRPEINKKKETNQPTTTVKLTRKFQ